MTTVINSAAFLKQMTRNWTWNRSGATSLKLQMNHEHNHWSFHNWTVVCDSGQSPPPLRLSCGWCPMQSDHETETSTLPHRNTSHTSARCFLKSACMGKAKHWLSEAWITQKCVTVCPDECWCASHAHTAANATSVCVLFRKFTQQSYYSVTGTLLPQSFHEEYIANPTFSACDPSSHNYI